MWNKNFALYLLLICCTLSTVAPKVVNSKVFNRSDFPPEFIFGSSTSAYQVEGAAFEDGRKASIFDTFAHFPWRENNGDVAANHYHKYKEDVQLMANTGLEAYRFSISWSRIIPDGRGAVNAKGVEFYNNLIDELISHGIQPHATLVHLDVPQALEDEYEGFLNQRIVEDFTAYADVCFREFGDRVLYWSTISEANTFVLGYSNGLSPPGRCSYPFGTHCVKGNSSTEPYIVAHNALLAHASTARLYREKYKDKQQGYVGFSLYGFHFTPFDDTTEDELAARRTYDFLIGLFMGPLTYGDYPEIVKTNVGNRLPTFTKSETQLIKGSFDFVGIHTYTVIWVKHTQLEPGIRDYVADMAAEWTQRNQSFDPVKSFEYPILPWGLKGVLEHFKDVYGNPPIYIYENGQVSEHNASLNDTSRVRYLQAYVGGLLEAVRNGSNTKGYFVWSFMDMFELLFGYEKGFGLYYVDFNDPHRPRYPKSSQNWYSEFLKGKNVTIEDQAENIPTIFESARNMGNKCSI